MNYYEKLEAKRQSRIGTKGVNKYNSEFVVVDYEAYDKVKVRFTESGYERFTTWPHTQRSSVPQPYDKSVYGVGYLGEGDFTQTRGASTTKAHKVWVDMLKRCYCPLEKARYTSYQEVGCVEDWHCFDNFARWYYSQVGASKPDYALDKDLAFKGNKVYGPETCFLLPPRLNGMLITNKSCRRKLPIGVFVKDKKYGAQCHVAELKRQKFLGQADTPEGAFEIYKAFKEKEIKRVADIYKDVIETRAYQALMAYQVEITD